MPRNIMKYILLIGVTIACKVLPQTSNYIEKFATTAAKPIVRLRDFSSEYLQSQTFYRLFIFCIPHLCNKGLVETCTVVISFSQGRRKHI